MILTIDFETYYSKEYSLTKLTTEEYIRDPRFEVIGVAVKVGDADTEWFSGSKEAVGKWLRQFPWEKSSALAHNMMFDGAILSWHFDIRPKFLLDTLSMGQALVGSHESVSLKNLCSVFGVGEKGDYVVNAMGKRLSDFTVGQLKDYAQYCVNDVDITYKLFHDLRPFPKLELFVIDRTLRMFTEPKIHLDRDMLHDYLSEIRQKRRNLLASVNVPLAAIRSDTQFGELLIAEGIDPPKKFSKTTGKETYAFARTDPGLLELADHPNEKIQALVAARLGLKTSIEESRAERFVAIAERGTLPVPLRYAAAHTWRWGGTDKINLQNLPSRGNSHKLKNSMMAPPGYVLVDCDSSQIEARVLAWVAGEDDVLHAFKKNDEDSELNPDVYRLTAARLYNKKVEDVTDEERFFGKTVVLGCGYGMGVSKLHLMLKQQGRKDVDEFFCNFLVFGYRNSVPKITEFWKKMENVIEKLYIGMSGSSTFKGGWIIENVLNLTMLGIEFPNEMLMRFKNLRRVDEMGAGWVYENKKGIQKLYGGKLTENIVQALARCIIAEQMIRISSRYPVVLMVHDSIVAMLPKDEADEGLEFMKNIMRTPPEWAKGLPLNCKGGYSERY